MPLVGIICEYNPLHLGHQKQFRIIREALGPDCGIVCLMSGAYVQRGAPAVFDLSLRAKAAILSGADLVLELPVTYALSSAEGFAAGGVRILSRLCDTLCFGTERLSSRELNTLAEALLSPCFSKHLREALDTGCSFPAARQKALEEMGISAASLSGPNDILAVEYCKAILSQGSPMGMLPIHRQGDYHDRIPDRENPSAASLRRQIEANASWLEYIPVQARGCFSGAAVHTLQAGQRAVLARLRTMTDAEFEQLPFGSEGLWRKLMHASRAQAGLEDVLTAVKSKRYTRTRLNRMVMCAFLGITESDLSAPVPYTRILAFNDRGREILNRVKDSVPLLNSGESSPEAFWKLEQRCSDLYGLFARESPEPPGAATRQRIYYNKGDTN